MSRRVVITGLGPVSAFGVGLDPLWQAMTEGRSAIRRVRAFDPSGFSCRVAAELDNGSLDIRQVVPRSYRKATKVMCRDVELAVAGAAAAVTDAGLITRAVDPDSKPSIPPGRLGCHVGAGLICAEVDELTSALWSSRNEDGQFDIRHWGDIGMNNLPPLWMLKYLPNMLACHVTIIHDCEGPSNTITCCEASGGLSIGESMRVIQRGAAEACLTGGAESKVNLTAFVRQHFAKRLAPTSDDEEPTAVVRPFDAEARGSVIGEGGGIIIVEDAVSARDRGRQPYAELLGFASTQSYCPDTVGLEVEPQGIADAIRIALDQARVDPAEVDAIVPQGLSIPQVDRAEAAAIRSTFGERAAEIPLITTVPNVGNCNAGAGTIATAVAANALRTQTLPARLNTAQVEGLDAGACPSREADLRYVLVTSTSQGGQNAAIVMGRSGDG